MDRQAKARACLRQLELRPGADWNAVRGAFKTLAQVWHPDRFADGTSIKGDAEARFKDITAAYQWLEANRSILLEVETGPEAQARSWGFAEDGPTPRDEATPDPPSEPSNPPQPPPWQRRLRLIWVRFRSALRRRVVFGALLLIGGVYALETSGFRILPRRLPEAVPAATEEVVLLRGASVRLSPMAQSQVVTTVGRGARIRVSERSGDWRQVISAEDPPEPVGWIEVGAIAKPDTGANETRLARPPDQHAAGRGGALGDATLVEPSEGAPDRWAGQYGAPSLAAATGLAEPETGWSRTLEWMGDTSAQTSTFILPVARWRLAWRTWGSGTFRVEVVDIDRDQVERTIELATRGATSYAHLNNSGTWRLRIYSEDVAWRVGVEVSR